jgi:phospholipid transport system substrate-binding protein
MNAFLNTPLASVRRSLPAVVVGLVLAVGPSLLPPTAMLTLVLPSIALAAEAPDEFVRKLSIEVLDQIRSDKAIQAGDPRRIFEFVDQILMPHINFERMTALVVGRAWRQATPEQQKRLMSEFRMLLLRTYSGALSQVRDEQIRMKPFRGDTSGDLVVRSEVVPRRGDPIQLDYRLEKAGDGWRIYDLNVLGVWLVETYRGQFSQEIGAHGIDGLIQSLTDKNKAFEQAARKG